jgi:hypothetical protein
MEKLVGAGPGVDHAPAAGETRWEDWLIGACTICSLSDPLRTWLATLDQGQSQRLKPEHPRVAEKLRTMRRLG